MRAYQAAVGELTARQLTTHYTAGLEFFRQEFAPFLKQRLSELTGGVWDLGSHVAYAAGSDVDFMAHLVEAVAACERVCLYPGDWHGFRVGCTQTERIEWNSSEPGALHCLCVPSVRNGHVTSEMSEFLQAAPACLLNLNLFPTLPAVEREAVARDLLPVLSKSVISISFSRGFGLTASQLGVFLVPQEHPYRERFGTQWEWFTYFYNAIAARAFMKFDLDEAATIDRVRSQWVRTWLEERGLPVVPTGSYYVKAFEPDGTLPEYLQPLSRDGIVRLCFKPPQI